MVLGIGLGGAQLVISVEARARERKSLWRSNLVEERLGDVVLAGTGRRTPGAKAPIFGRMGRPKAKALGYLEAKAPACGWPGRSRAKTLGYLEAKAAICGWLERSNGVGMGGVLVRRSR